MHPNFIEKTASINTKTILITIDVEDWFQVENLRPWFPQTSWDNQDLRVEANTHKLLDLFDSINTQGNTQKPKGTFFILGWIAERLPNLIREIYKRGHEVASHGYSHLMCQQHNGTTLTEDLSRSKKFLEDTIGHEVYGYRAPNFSISDKALDIIQACGYHYDSSYNNFSRHGRYGKITLNEDDKIGAAYSVGHNYVELPISNLSIGKQIIPWGGGGYFRFIPLSVFKIGVQSILKKTGVYMFYLHPWEIDPGQPKVKEATGLSGWRHYLNLDKTQSRLYNLIESFNNCKFSTCSQYLADVL